MKRKNKFLTRLRYSIVLMTSVVTLISCTTQVADQPYSLSPPDAKIAPVIAVPSIRERMIFLAIQEWTLFGNPVADYRSDPPHLIFPGKNTPANEADPALFSRVNMYWQRVSSLPLFGYEGELRPWSAAFISWLARSAGISESDLPSSVLHWDYIEHILKQSPSGRFIARDARSYAPKPGDLICSPRGKYFIAKVDSFANLVRGAYHCDLAVNRHERSLMVIGGNVLDTVTMTEVELDSNGHVVPTACRPWRLIIEQRTP
jgi:hypothetical protein